MVHGDEDEGAEPATLGVGAGEGVAFQQAGEKGLGQILGVMDGITAPPHIGVKRIPVGLAEAGQGVPGPGGVAPGGEHDDGPMGGGKHGPGIDGSETGVLRGGHVP